MNNITSYLYEAITFETFLKFSILYFIIIWIAVLMWVIKDITSRTDNIYLQLFSILIVLFLTPFGIFIYLLIRPSKSLFEKYYEEIEENLEIFHEIIEDRIKEKSKNTEKLEEFEKVCNKKNKKRNKNTKK